MPEPSIQMSLGVIVVAVLVTVVASAVRSRTDSRQVQATTSPTQQDNLDHPQASRPAAVPASPVEATSRTESARSAQ